MRSGTSGCHERMAREGGDRRTAMRAALTLCTLALWLAALAPSALADPAHPRTPTLDVTGLNHACGAAVDSKGNVYAS